MPLAPDAPRCHGYTPAFWPRPVEMCRSCQRYTESTTAAKLTPWLHADSLVTIPKSWLDTPIGPLPNDKLKAVDDALKFSLGLP